MSENIEQRRTKRRYAHELYPHPAEGEIRPLSVEVPYLYARMVGFDVWGTSWFDIGDEPFGREFAGARMHILIETRERALLADALLQGMTGDEAWAWAERYAQDETGECAYDRAHHYGVPIQAIKPYPCGPELDHHNHLGAPGPHGIGRIVARVEGRESGCPECTELVQVHTEQVQR